MTARRLRMRRHSKRVKLAVRILLVVVAVMVVFSGVATAFGYAVIQQWLKDLPKMDTTKLAQATRIYSADGTLLARLYLENREVVPLDKISPYLQKGVIAVEDERFYQHGGYDLYGIARAAVKDVTAGGAVQGASTLTQQYIRQTVLSQEATQVTLARKFREIYLAQELEKRYTKDQILAMYLNAVYFGDGAYGAEAAARHYFYKSAKDLSLAQAAMLAGLPNSPGRLDPYEKANLPRAIGRQHWVLQKMLEQGYITKEQHDKAIAVKLAYKSAPQTADGIYAAPYFASYVKKQLQVVFGKDLVFKGGLTVHTTIDLGMQAKAERAVKDALNQPGDPSAAVVSIDPGTGYIKAMVGGNDYAKNKFNLATQGKRQPGSSFKTFVLVTALEKGIPPTRAFDSDSPAIIPYKPHDWVVYNSEGQGYGYMSLQDATANSVNCVYARLIEELGPPDVVSMAKRMGITSYVPNYPSIALGTMNATPLEMASAYGTLAANGVHAKAISITKVADSEGKTIYDGKPQRKQAISREIAYAATRILTHVISGGTGTAADIGRPEAGKTGTSQNYRDAWFVGYTPQLVTSVWVGYYSEKPMSDVHGTRVFGGTFPAEIWNQYMSSVLAGQPALDFASAPDPNYIWKDSWRTESPPPAPRHKRTRRTTGTYTKPENPIVAPPVTPPKKKKDTPPPPPPPTPPTTLPPKAKDSTGTP